MDTKLGSTVAAFLAAEITSVDVMNILDQTLITVIADVEVYLINACRLLMLLDEDHVDFQRIQSWKANVLKLTSQRKLDKYLRVW
jgi:hypothetical protein